MMTALYLNQVHLWIILAYTIDCVGSIFNYLGSYKLEVVTLKYVGLSSQYPKPIMDKSKMEVGQVHFNKFSWLRVK